MDGPDSKLTRIGVFYDGGFFTHVNNYYYYVHTRRARLNIDGLHAFIRDEVAKAEGVDARYCQIVDAHYFRGRLPAREAEVRQVLMAERQWDEVLMRQGIVTHYLPLSIRDGKPSEKGIDVWFALEAFELAIYKRFNVSVLIACDSDYVPLVRKLNTLGTRVMLLGWDFMYHDEAGQERRTTTSIELLEEVTYPVLLSNIIDDKTRRNDALVNNLFLPSKPAIAPPKTPAQPLVAVATAAPPEGLRRGEIKLLKEGYGLIQAGTDRIFFHHSTLVDRDFEDLRVGDKVDFTAQMGEKGLAATQVQMAG